jgi:hypothetical protein
LDLAFIAKKPMHRDQIAIIQSKSKYGKKSQAAQQPPPSAKKNFHHRH